MCPPRTKSKVLSTGFHNLRYRSSPYVSDYLTLQDTLSTTQFLWSFSANSCLPPDTLCIYAIASSPEFSVGEAFLSGAIPTCLLCKGADHSGPRNGQYFTFITKDLGLSFSLTKLKISWRTEVGQRSPLTLHYINSLKYDNCMEMAYLSLLILKATYL